MFWHNISRHVYVDEAIAPVASGAAGTAQVGYTIDTAGFESILIAVSLGASGVGFTGATIQLQYGTQSNGSDMANVPVPAVPETGQTAASSVVNVPSTGQNLGYLAVELFRPTKRYARIVVTPAGGTLTINGGFVLMSRGALQPPSQGVNMGNVVPGVLVSP